MGNIEQLKQFVSDNIELNGVWVSPGGDKKKYSDGDTSISWRKGNKVLRIEGKGKNQINAKLCSIICNSGISPEEAGAAINLSSVSHCTTSELSVEMEGVKLDITIAEKDICNNKLTIENVEARLNKLTEDFGKVSKQLDNCRRAEIYFLNNQHRDRSSPAFEYSNMADMGHSTREKLCYEKATSTIDLTVNNQINDVNSVVKFSPDNMPPIEILDKATSTIDLTVNNQINDANVVEFSPENTPPIEILDRATENSRSNQSCIILNSCSGSSKQDAIPLDVRNQIDEICDKTNFQSISPRIQSISTRIPTRRPPVNIVPKHNSTALVGNQIDKIYDETNFQSIPTRITMRWPLKRKTTCSRKLYRKQMPDRQGFCPVPIFNRTDWYQYLDYVSEIMRQ